MRNTWSGAWHVDEVRKAMNQPCNDCGLRPGTEATDTFGYAYPICVECKTERLREAAKESVKL